MSRQAVLCPRCQGAGCIEETIQHEDKLIVSALKCNACDGFGFVAVIIDHLKVWNPFIEEESSEIEVASTITSE